jgi:hypothetical protein
MILFFLRFVSLLVGTCKTDEIPVNRELCYHSGKEKGSSRREDNPVVSKAIGKTPSKAISYVA